MPPDEYFYESCPSINDVFTDSGYRFFNQPIEQIPNYDAELAQVLGHSPNGGLIWVTVNCLSVVTCLKIEEDKLVIERNNVIVVHDFGVDEDKELCPNIETTSCEEEIEE